MGPDMQQFVTEALRSSFHTVEVPVGSLPDYYDALERALYERGERPEQVIAHLASGGDLRAICPRCSSWVDGQRIAMLSAARKMGSGSIYGPGARLACGLCQNAACPETTTRLIWGRNQPLRQRTDACLSQKELQSNRYLQETLSPDVLAYTHDLIFNQTRLFLVLVTPTSVPRYLYKGMQFLSKALGVFGSVLPWSEDPRLRHRTMFGQNYLSFFETLLETAGYYTSETSILHWTYMFDWDHEYDWGHEMEGPGSSQSDRSRLFIAFFPPDNAMARPSEKGVVILPLGLLTEEEVPHMEGQQDSGAQRTDPGDKPSH